MHLIVCIDERNGMAFGGRRLSKDRRLREDMLTLTEGNTLWMSPYSAAQFEEAAPQIRACGDFLALAGEGEYCFCETALPEDRIENLILYRWNRHYPADLHLPRELPEQRLLVQVTEFPGFSHENITREVYVL